MRWVLGLGAGCVVVAVGAVIALFGIASSESTVCSARFDAEGAARVAAVEGEAAGLETEVDPRNKHAVVTFRTSETGSDADAGIAEFFRIAHSHDGKVAHPGGCTVRSFAD